MAKFEEIEFSYLASVWLIVTARRSILSRKKIWCERVLSWYIKIKERHVVSQRSVVLDGIRLSQFAIR